MNELLKPFVTEKRCLKEVCPNEVLARAKKVLKS